MNCIKRAFLHDIRKAGKTLLLFSILLVIGILLLTCFSIRRGTQIAALNIRQSLKGSFSIDAKASDGQLTNEVLQNIRQMPGIKNYNGRSSSYAEYVSEDGAPLEVMTEGSFDVADGFEHAGKVVADSFSQQDELFTQFGFQLTEGRPIVDGSEHTAVIHQWLAARNNLNIGDTIQLRLNEQMLSEETTASGDVKNTVSVKIIGIFDSTRPQPETILLSHAFYQNTIFIDPKSFSELFPKNGSLYYETADFQVDDPETLDALIEQIQHTEDVAWENCAFTKHAADYEHAKGSLQALEQLVTFLLFIILAVSAALLILILALWIRSRVHETGVYAAMGIGKGNILLQHLTEVCLIAICAFTLAAACSSGIAKFVGEHLLKQSAVPEFEVSHFTDAKQQNQAEEIVELTQLQIHVSAQDIVLVYSAGMLLILLSVIIAAIPVLRLKPKEILTKTN